MSSDNKKSSNIKNDIEKKESFFEKMRNEKRYNAKVQLIGYGILIGALIIYLNLSNLVSGGSNSNLSLDDFNDNLINNSGESTEVNKNLLKSLANNYVYDIVIHEDVIKSSIFDVFFMVIKNIFSGSEQCDIIIHRIEVSYE